MATEADPAKLQVVLDWLKATFGSAPVPNFEINAGTVAVLYELAIKNQRSNAEAEVEIELLKKTSAETAAQSTVVHPVLKLTQRTVRQTDEILKALGLSVQELPESVRMYIKALSAVASSLGISDSELTSFYPAIREILKMHQSATKRKEAEKEAYENLVAKLREAIAVLNEAQQLSAAVQAAAPQQEQQVLKERQNIDYMESKRREYQTKNAALQSQVAAVGLTPELHHAALVKQSEEVARLNAAIAPKLQSLKAFGDLPPDVTLANAQIQEAKVRLAKLEQQLRHQINALEL